MTNTTTATETTATYRKTRQGEWVVFATKQALTAAKFTGSGYVTVTKRDGSTKQEEVARIGRGFMVDGVEMAYGYIAKHAPVERYTERDDFHTTRRGESPSAAALRIGRSYGVNGQVWDNA